jgi:hypothetical protein
LSKINTSDTKINQGGPMDNKKIGLILLIIGVILCLGAIPAVELATISFETGIGTVTAGGLSPVSVALIFVGIVFMAFGAYLRIKK